MPRPTYQWTVGNGPNARRVGSPEQGWLTGNGVRRWWVYISWWAIPLAVYLLLFGPRWGSVDFGAPNTASTPVVIHRSTPHPAPAPVAPPRRNLTPEERAEQYKAERRRQYGIQ